MLLHGGKIMKDLKYMGQMWPYNRGLYVSGDESISTVPAPSLSAVNNQELFFDPRGAVDTQERLILKDYFFKSYYSVFLDQLR